MRSSSGTVDTRQMRAGFSSANHRFHDAVRWDPAAPAEWIEPHILMSRANSNRYLVTTDGGDLLINTGDPKQAVRHRERFEQLLGRPLDVRAIVFTQSHPDHYSGWAVYGGEEVETIAHRSFPEGVLDRQRLAGFFEPRRDRTSQWGRTTRATRPPAPDARITTFVDDRHGFELGDRRFELLSAPGGETPDSLFVWLPDERTVFTGNHAGALYLSMPNLTTIRGDRLRSARKFLLDVDRLLALEPELLVTGHDEPIRGAERIRTDLVRIRDAVQYVHDETVRGMNEGRTVHELMREIELPPELELEAGRAPTAWCVRAVWEEYAGWFRFESPTELYGVAPREVWPEICELVGADALAARAETRIAAGEPVEALHLAEVALAGDPGNEQARAVRVAALEQLIERTGGRTFDELSYLESELERARTGGAEPAK
jgi:alkyl sulfatase BDS1-like metallo-beta-lactamase superfamily hydrolase